MAGGRSAENTVWSYEDPREEAAAAGGYLAFYWDRMDAWYEEEEEIFVHPRNPYVRVDVLESARRVKVLLGGTVLAQTRRPRLLFETGHPTRFYLPKEDVRMDFLSPSPTRTRCPYKGAASHWSAEAGGRRVEDIAWSYEDPIAECPRIRGLICFYPERVDSLLVDGEETGGRP